jgi:hypothetical protein
LDAILGAHTLVLSRFLLDEVERVLLYPRMQVRYNITANEAARSSRTETITSPQFSLIN